jgi:predicted dehydrogenase
MADTKRSLVIGYGSIGQRHEAVLRTLGAETAVVSRHAHDISCPCFQTVQEAINKFQPQYIVVANRTSEHLEALEQIQKTGFHGLCLVEKPLADHSISTDCDYGFEIRAGYVMRFHPLIRQAAEILEGRRLLSIDAYVGQYLPDWRPGTDYRQCYSSRKEQGGGVLRDLSHELDYIQFFAGAWQRVSALGGHISELEIDTDDMFSLLMKTQHCPAVLCQMNYLDRNVRRDCTIQYEGGTLHLDFVGKELIHNGTGQAMELERNAMFEAMHAAAWLPGAPGVCSFEEAVQTLELIEAAERSAGESCWVCRKSR